MYYYVCNRNLQLYFRQNEVILPPSCQVLAHSVIRCKRTFMSIEQNSPLELYRRFPDNHFPGQTFLGPVQDVSRTSRFPDKTFPGETFPDKLYQGIFIYIIYVNTSSVCLVARYVGIRSVY